MNPLHLFGLKIAGVTLVLGTLAGGYIAHLFYAPRLDLAESRVERLAESLELQNKAVEGLQEADRRRAARAKAAIESAEAGRVAAEAQVVDLMGRQLPAGADQCVAASDLIRRELGK